jgi:hypothetical protein
LLGQLAGEALEQFEEQFFADDSLFQEVLVAEDELIDESLSDALNDTESELFARNFVNSPERKHKLLFRRVLKGYVERKKPRKVVPRRWAFLTDIVYPYRTAITSAALVIIAAIIALVPFLPHRPATFATLNLSMGSSQRATGAHIPKVALPLKVDELRLQLELPEPATPGQTYRVELVRIDGKTRTLKTVSQDYKSVVVAISDSQLEAGRYALNLYATKPGEAEQRIAGSYFFTAE